MTQPALWTIKAMLDWCEPYLKAHGDQHSRLSAQLLLADVTGLDRVGLYTSFDRPLSSKELAVMREHVRRRAEGAPIQYITGEAHFRHLTLEARPGVLIPRPETEVLVEVFIDRLREAACDQPLHLAEIGCGSGCIACSLAYELPGAFVVASDLSPEACALTRANADRHGLSERLTVREGDCARAFDDYEGPRFDGLISNPPYVPTAVWEALDSEVRDHEPRLALDGGASGLDFAEPLLQFALDKLKPGGVVAFELFEERLEDAAALARDHGFTDLRVTEDLTGRPRVLSGLTPAPSPADS